MTQLVTQIRRPSCRRLGRDAAAWLIALVAIGCGSATGADLFESPASGAGSGKGGTPARGGSGGAIVTGGSGGQQLVTGGTGGGTAGTGGGIGGLPNGMGGQLNVGGQANSGGLGGQPVLPPVCGNGIPQAGEECDDGNMDPTDGCDQCVVDCQTIRPGSTKSPYNFHCYEFVDRSTNFDAAQTHCSMLTSLMGITGHLITISSVDENQFALTLAINHPIWIGASDNKSDTDPSSGPFQWVTGELWSYTNWQMGEPDTGATSCPGPGMCYEHCAVQLDTGFWDDTVCSQGHDYICEWDPPGQ
jgi:cysteine-rich repeat protein